MDMISDEGYMAAMNNTFRWRQSQARAALMKMLDIGQTVEVGVCNWSAINLKWQIRIRLHKRWNKSQNNQRKMRLNTLSLHLWQGPQLEKKTLREQSSCVTCLKVRLPYVNIPSFNTSLADLQGKSLDDLKAMAGELSGLVRRMQEQAGYWLDAKEQLVMDAEMHNKMIASLVQYATQQQLQGNKKSPGKKAKKWRGFSGILYLIDKKNIPSLSIHTSDNNDETQYTIRKDTN